VTSQSNSVLNSSLKSFSHASSFIVIIVGCLVLVGWAFDIAALKSVLPGLVTMKANTAMAFVLLGMSLWLLQSKEADQRMRRIAQAYALAVTFLGLLTLSEYLFGLNLGIDQLLFKEPPEAAGPFPPDRMTPATALNFLLLASALLLLDVEKRSIRYLSQSLTLLVGITSLLSLGAYVYNDTALIGGFSYTRMSLHTAPTFIILCSGILCARPDRGLMVVIASDSTGGLMARRLLPAAIVIPLLLSWFRLEGERAGLYGLEFGLALFALSNVVIFAVLIWWNARLLGELDTLRRQEAAKFQTLVESAPDSIVTTDRNGTIVFANSRTEKTFGYSRNELLGKPVEILIPERYRQRHMEDRGAYIVQPHPRPMGTSLELYGRRKDGSDFPVDISLSPFETKDGLFVTSTIRDITERKHAEETLKLRASQQMTVAELGQRALTGTDLSLLMDEAVSRVSETLKAEYCKVLELLPDGKALVLRAGVGWKDGYVGRATMGAGADSQAGYTLLSAEPVIVEDLRTETRFTGPPLLHEHGVVSGMSTIIQGKDRPFGVLGAHTTKQRIFIKDDIHFLQAVANVLSTAIEYRRAENQVQSNLERIHALHEMDLAITATLDLRTILDILLEKIDRLLPFVTAATVRLLNRETGELEPVACRNLDEAEWKVATAAATTKGLARLLPEKNTPAMVLNVQTDPRSLAPEFLRKYGLVSSLRVPLAAKKEVLGALTFFTKEEHQFTDEEVEFLTTLAGQAAVAIHNAQLYEEMGKLAANLSKANTVKDQFLSVMSHELRTPLNVVMGYTGMIKDGILGDINPQQEEALDKVLNRANEQLTMINNVLYATVIETEKVKAEMVEVDLGGFLSNLRTAYHGPIHKNLTLNWDYPLNLPVIKTDSAKLKQILQNLINNAIKFTEKGNVTISARIRHEATGIRQQEEHVTSASSLTPSDPHASRLPPHAFVEFKVADTGVGIPKEHLPIIFEKFRQVDSSETRLFGGVGMGLYIVKKLTELLRGKVEVESEPGEGSAFTVTIPCS